MMGRDWKPGDMAIAMLSTRGPRIIRRRCSDAAYPWEVVGGDDLGGFVSERAVLEAAPIGPFVVLDPERLVKGLPGRLLGTLLAAAAEIVKVSADGREVNEVALLEHLADLFDAATEPRPKPEEPKGLGAVVEDADGKRWVRSTWADPGYYAWRCADQPHSEQRFCWSDIAAVHVRSEGWSV